MADKKQLQVNLDDLKLEIPPHLKGGVYANTVNVTASNNEVTLNFVYFNPADDPNGTLVSRVIVSPSFIKNLADVLDNITKDLEKETGK